MHPSATLFPQRSRAAASFSVGLLAALLHSAFLPVSAADTAQVDHLKLTLNARQHHADVLLEELRATDKRVESRMENLVTALKAVADSKDSKTKVARLKEETIGGLTKSIEIYNRKREEIQEQIVRPTANLTDAQKKQIRKALDSRIEKRVAQIVELQKSMPTHQDYEKYKIIGGGDGWNNTILKNEDWEQNRRVTLHSDQLRNKLMEELRHSASRLEEQNRRLQQQLQTNAGAETMLKAEIQRNDELLAARQLQLDEVLSEAPAITRPIGKGEAGALDDAVKVAVTGLKMEINRLFAQYTALVTFLPQVNAARTRLDQASPR
jgi:hypothetical protein